jgi:hypothetical protein
MSLILQIFDPGLSRDHIVIVQVDLLLFNNQFDSTNITSCDIVITIGRCALQLDTLSLMLSH